MYHVMMKLFSFIVILSNIAVVNSSYMAHEGDQLKGDLASQVDMPTAMLLIFTRRNTDEKEIAAVIQQVLELNYPETKLSIAINIYPSNYALNNKIQNIYVKQLKDKNYKKVSIVTSDAQSTEQLKNNLLISSISSESYVLWLSSRVVNFPSSLLIDLLSFNRHCIMPRIKKLSGYLVPFISEKNTPHTDDFQFVEPFSTDIVLLDTNFHRNGFVFLPEKDATIKLAASMGIKCLGLVHYPVTVSDFERIDQDLSHGKRRLGAYNENLDIHSQELDTLINHVMKNAPEEISSNMKRILFAKSKN